MGKIVSLELKRTFSYFLSIDQVTMSIHFGAFKLGVPDGFKAILESITREVLREQPTDIPKFIAQYLKELMKKRAEGADARFVVKKSTITLAHPPGIKVKADKCK